MDNLLRHNLRNDMTVVLGHADLVAREADEPTPEPFDLVDAVTDAVETARERYPDAAIDLELAASAPVTALPEIRVAVLELLENVARHAETDRPEATVAVRSDGDRVELPVTDRCPPIPEEEFRVLTGDREMGDVYHSTGLGLWLVQWIVDLSDGSVAFERADDGNTVRVRLSAADG